MADPGSRAEQGVEPANHELDLSQGDRGRQRNEAAAQPLDDLFRAELEKCFRRYADAVHRQLIVAVAPDRSLAEDLVQETFRAVAESWSRVRTLDEESLAARIRTIARNKAVDAYRHKKVRAAALLRLPCRRDLEPESAGIAAAETATLFRILAGLPVKKRTIAVLRWQYEMTEPEIAQELGIPRGTVATVLRAVRKRFEASLGDHAPQESR